MNRRIAPLLFLLFACGGGSLARPEETASRERAPEPERLAIELTEARTLQADERVTLETATFDAPAGFTLERAAGSVRLTSPERDLRIIVAEIEGSSAEEAIAAAWARYVPDFARSITMRAAGVPTDGWEEVLQIGYDVPASESRAVVGIGRRRGDRVAVVLIDGRHDGLGRRGAALNLAVESLRLPGVVRETLAGREQRRFEGPLVAELEAFVEHALAARQVPGAAIAIVQRGEVVYTRGFGVRRLGTDAPVTPRTLFMIGSNTKPLTSALMARLVDTGRAEWTTPLRDLLPEFALADEAITARVQLQHTVCACTGLPRRDLELVLGTPRGADWLGILRESTPSTGFGEVFQYSNLMVAAGGFAAARRTTPRGSLADAYRAAMQREVFGPLGMRDTTLRAADATRREHAVPHGYTFTEEIAPMPVSLEAGVEAVAPAGAAWSTVGDLSRYAIMELRDGALPRGRYLSEAALHERRAPRVRISETLSYGLALMVREQYGLSVIEHGGNNLGFTSNIKMFPEEDLAIVVLTNAAGANRLIGTIERRILELVYDGAPLAADQLRTWVENLGTARREMLARAELDPPRESYERYLGRYENPSLGALTLEERDGHFVGGIGLLSSRLGALRAGGESVWIFLDPPLAGLEIIPPSDATSGALRIDYPQMPYDFVRRDP